MAEQWQGGERRCSFCAKHESQVKCLITGFGGVLICNECVTLASEIIEDERTIAGAPATPRPRSWWRFWRR